MECENCGLDNPAEARFCANCGTALITAVKQPLPAEPTTYAEPAAIPEYVGFWSRLVAAIVDGVVVWLLSYALSFLIGLLGSEYYFLHYFSHSFPILLLYYWLFTGLRGQTLGKMLAGIKVVDSKGNKPGLAVAALREIPGKIISTVVFFLGFLWITWDEHKQGLHDKLATTYVIKSETGK